ncbi:MAG TPA: hypothetical protein VFU78_20900, partial [Thermomicrobiales bacterium]|nr:hypothetical protein [Thermomicrobiales bacterium]
MKESAVFSVGRRALATARRLTAIPAGITLQSQPVSNFLLAADPPHFHTNAIVETGGVDNGSYGEQPMSETADEQSYSQLVVIGSSAGGIEA